MKRIVLMLIVLVSLTLSAREYQCRLLMAVAADKYSLYCSYECEDGKTHSIMKEAGCTALDRLVCVLDGTCYIYTPKINGETL